MISSISLFDIISVIILDFSVIILIVAEATAVYSNGNKTLLANEVSRFFFNGKLTFITGPRKLLSNPPT